MATAIVIDAATLRASRPKVCSKRGKREVKQGHWIGSLQNGNTRWKFEHEMMTVGERRHLRVVVYFPSIDRDETEASNVLCS